jgi:hypothetical protein
MQEKVQLLAEQWIICKTWLVEYVGFTNDAMHVHGSILILFVSAIVLRRRPDSIWCWLIVLLAELFNEYADLRGIAPGEETMDAAIHDLYNTMLWPTVILILGRFLFPSRKKDASKDAAPSANLANQSFEQPAPV